MKKIHIVVGIALMLLGASTLVTAYHIPDDGGEVGPLGKTANDWVNPVRLSEPITGEEITTGDFVVVCESMGPDDKINPNPVPNPGVGGLCYASSKHIGDPENTPEENKTLWKDKKDDKTSQDDWGAVTPTCFKGDDPLALPFGSTKGVECNGSKNETTQVGEDWFARIGSNTRSCTGAWGQTFAYKEVVAYWAGAGPNTQGDEQGGGQGVSGHVTFFVDDGDEGAQGSYEGSKIDDPELSKDEKTLANCTGNGDSWGVSGEVTTKTS